MLRQSGDRQYGIGGFDEGRVSVGEAAAAVRNCVPARMAFAANTGVDARKSVQAEMQ